MEQFYSRQHWIALSKNKLDNAVLVQIMQSTEQILMHVRFLPDQI